MQYREPITFFDPFQDTNAQQLVAKARDGFLEGDINLLVDVARINPFALYEAYMQNRNIYGEMFALTFADILLKSKEIRDIMVPYFANFVVPGEDVDYLHVPDYMLLSDFLPDFTNRIRREDSVLDFYQKMVNAGAEMVPEDIYQTLGFFAHVSPDKIRKYFPTIDDINPVRIETLERFLGSLFSSSEKKELSVITRFMNNPYTGKLLDIYRRFLLR